MILSPVCPRLSEEPITGHSTPGVASPALNIKDHLPQSACNTFPNAIKHTTSLLCNKGILLVHALCDVHWDFKVLLCQDAFQLDGLNIYSCMESFLTRCTTLYFCLLNFVRFLSAHFSSLSKFLRMAAHLSGVSANPLSSFYNPSSNTLYPIIQVINDRLNRTGLSIISWG